MPESTRAFFAVALPEAVRERIIRSRERRLPDHPAIRPTPIESLHLTLAFLGEVPNSMLGPLGKTVGDAIVHQSRFELELDRLGAFPSINDPRVYWLGLNGEALPMLLELQRRIVAACDASSVPPSDRRFHPHITIARTSRRDPRDQTPGPIDLDGDDDEPEIIPVENVTLFRSTLGRSGPSYRVIEAWILANATT